MTGVFFVAKLQTATPDMFNFSVSSMILVMVVLGGMGSVWGVVLGAVLLQLMQIGVPAAAQRLAARARATRSAARCCSRSTWCSGRSCSSASS